MPRSRHIPQRSCVACGRKLPKRELLRVVRTPQGDVQPDPTGKAPGRGTYLCNSVQCWERGVHRGGLERGLHTSLSSQDRELLLAFCQRELGDQSPNGESNDH